MLSCMHCRCICMKGLCPFAVKDPWSSKCIAEPYLPGTGITPPSHYKLQILSSQSCFCSADALKISENPGCPQIILPKQDIIFLMTATASNHSPASVCLSILTCCGTGPSFPQALPNTSQAAGPSPHGVVLRAPSTTASPLQHGHRGPGRDSPRSSRLLMLSQFTHGHQTRAFYFCCTTSQPESASVSKHLQ